MRVVTARALRDSCLPFDQKLSVHARLVLFELVGRQERLTSLHVLHVGMTASAQVRDFQRGRDAAIARSGALGLFARLGLWITTVTIDAPDASSRVHVVFPKLAELVVHRQMTRQALITRQRLGTGLRADRDEQRN